MNQGRVAQLVSASVRHTEGSGFKSQLAHLQFQTKDNDEGRQNDASQPVQPVAKEIRSGPAEVFKEVLHRLLLEKNPPQRNSFDPESERCSPGGSRLPQAGERRLNAVLGQHPALALLSGCRRRLWRGFGDRLVRNIGFSRGFNGVCHGILLKRGLKSATK